MKRLAAILSFCCLLATAQAQPQGITVTRKGSQPSRQGPAEHFTGAVRVDPLFSAIEPSRVSAGLVTFEPGARAAWHTHPLGQVLIVTAGKGWVGHWDGPVQEIREGDVVRIPPGQKHWHGATPETRLTHIALQEHLNGKVVDWMEKVTEEQYTMAQTREESGPAPSSGQMVGDGQTVTNDDLRSVAPALEKFTRDRLNGEVWNRPGLSPRDRGIVTLAALVARNQTAAFPDALKQALDNGVKPSEVSELITHLAFYSGWGNALGAVALTKDVFAARGVGTGQLPLATEKLLPLNEAAEAQRAAHVQASFGSVAPGVVQYTTDLLFRDLWLRPGLAPRDRSLVTVSALIASGQVAQIPYHLNRAMDTGLTQEQASEALTHLAFYAGWPNVFSALPVVKDVFEKRTH